MCRIVWLVLWVGCDLTLWCGGCNVGMVSMWRWLCGALWANVRRAGRPAISIYVLHQIAPHVGVWSVVRHRRVGLATDIVWASPTPGS